MCLPLQVLDGLRSPPVILRPGSVTYEQLLKYPGMQQLQVGAWTLMELAVQNKSWART